MYRPHADLDKAAAHWTLTVRASEERKPPAMDHELFREIHAHLDRIEGAVGPDGPVALVVRSAHPKVFLAGANIGVLETLDKSTMAAWVVEGHRLLDRLEALPIPVIAVVSGYALGGGLELALACDFIYSTDSVRFGQTEARLGFVSGWGGAYRLSRRTGTARAKELFFTGRILDASEALKLGIVNIVGSSEQVEEQLAETLSAIAGNSRGSVTRIKGILNIAADPAAARRCAMEEAVASQSCITDPDTGRRLTEFLEGRKKK